MAQTTHLASFWPFFIFVGLRWPLLAAVGLRGRRPGQLWVWWVRNKLYILKKNLPMAPTTQRALFGPFFLFIGLRWALLAAVGFYGLSWASSGPTMGVVGKK